jgi:outer membrane protein assembly factor BamA
MDDVRIRVRAWMAIACLALGGCAASIPEGSYGVSSLDIKGVEHFDDGSIKACLATYPRGYFGFELGGAEAEVCGEPPFDRSHIPINLWRWPWTDWPIYNDTAFERDLDRIERWYVARGYYDAKVTRAELHKNESSRQLDLEVQVKEGAPVLVVRVTIQGINELGAKLQGRVRKAIQLELGEPFDEALYERSKRAVLETLREAAYAKATVTGKAMVDPIQKIARVELTVEAGPPCVFGAVTVVGNRKLSARSIEAAADLKHGEPFSLSALREARYAVYGLGPFASVEVEERPRPNQPIVDVVITVVPARPFRFGVGAGVSAGGLYTTETDALAESYAQWDTHLLGRMEYRNFLGGMRRLRIEERPRLIFDNPFPSTRNPSLGNLFIMELRQPAFIEPRTTLVALARWDYGPDLYGGHFERHDILAGVGPQRYFFEGKLLVSASINADLFLPQKQDPYPNNEATYLYYVARVDLRDDPRNTHRGSFFLFGVQQGGYFLPSDWNYIRLTQDSRGYLPLPGGMVLAGRARIGFMDVTHSNIKVPSPETNDPVEQMRIPFLLDLRDFGPLRHRLRGGGQNDVRGYAPNTLGDVEEINNRLLSGGLRQWEATIELRVPISENFGTVVFTDAGDVSRSTSYRFNYPQLSFGLGLRYRTLVGPLRFDAAIAPPGLQTFGPDNRIRYGVPQSHLIGNVDGAISFTIGEAF